LKQPTKRYGRAEGPRSLLLRLLAEPASVPQARRVVSEHLSGHISAGQLESIRLGLSEAVGNVVRHAYPAGARGELEVEVVSANDDCVQVQVRDWGCGRAHASPQTAGTGWGTPLMQALSNEFVTGERRPRGTEVRMSFSRA
jgi:anti-sigma regulatory factor (Ser/Thr protein kinase)